MSKEPETVPFGEVIETDGVLSKVIEVLSLALPLQSDALAVKLCVPCNPPLSSVAVHVAEPFPLSLQRL
jgi:hypothetical protein